MLLDMNNTQLNLLYNHFVTKGDISRHEADSLYRIASLSRRVNDLEARGVGIARENKVDVTGHRYVRYHYVGEVAASTETI